MRHKPYILKTFIYILNKLNYVPPEIKPQVQTDISFLLIIWVSYTKLVIKDNFFREYIVTPLFKNNYENVSDFEEPKTIEEAVA